MARIELHPDFKDFLRLLNSHNARYLLVGGYAELLILILKKLLGSGPPYCKNAYNDALPLS